MTAPVPPGNDNPGDATGDDSGQGSGSGDDGQAPTAPVITSVRINSGSGYVSLPSEGKRTFYHKQAGTHAYFKIEGTGLSSLPALKLKFIYGDSEYDGDLKVSSSSTDTSVICYCKNTMSMDDIAVSKIYGDGITVYDGSALPLVATVNASSADETMGSVNGGGEYAYNSAVVLTAVPEAGYHFKQWNDDSTDNPLTVSANRNCDFVAEFEADVVEQQPENNHPETVHLSVTRIGDGGVVYVDELCCALPYEADYAYGTTVKLAASYNQNWYFKKWSDGSTNSVKTVVLTEDTNLEIEFFFDDSDDLDDNIK